MAELCVVRKPVVFVPFPFAAEDHQTLNAQKLVDQNAALLVRDREAIEILVPTLIHLLDDETRQKEIKENIGKLAITDADEVIAREVIRAIR